MPAAESSTAAAAAVGLKSGLLASVAAIVVSMLAVVVGFTIVPLTPGREHVDAARRLAAGLLSSFTLGPFLTFKLIDLWPGYLTPWQAILAGREALWIYLAAAAPCIAITAVLGFWIVAAVMRFFTKREGQDIAQLAEEVRKQLGGGKP